MYMYTNENHIQVHKTNLNTFLKNEIIWNMFPDHNRIKLEVIDRKITRKSNTWKLSNILLNNS